MLNILSKNLSKMHTLSSFGGAMLVTLGLSAAQLKIKIDLVHLICKSYT